MSKIIVLGAGMVGSAMAIDLAKQHQVRLTDIDPDALHRAGEKCGDLSTRWLDVTNRQELQDEIRSHDLVINAVPGFLGYETLKAIIEADMNVIDIAFFPENSLELDELAKKHQVTAIVDCGVAPGMDNVILLSGNVHFAEVSRLGEGVSHPLTEITSSGMTHVEDRYGKAPNRFRVGGPFIDLNFGMLEVDWETGGVELRVCDVNGKPVLRHQVR